MYAAKGMWRRGITTVPIVVLLCIAMVGPNALQARHPQTVDARQAPSGSLDQALLKRYCISCHNDKLKTSGLTLEPVDVTRVQDHAEVLEKVLQKVRMGQMPPAGRPRPDDTELRRFVSGLEGALDRAAVGTPNPGRVAPRRLNRAEYVHVIRDWLALDINGEELLPTDLAGFGFDNNADALTITPGLMARYMSAATKISRMAVGSRSNRPGTQVYHVPLGALQNARMGEDLPFATRGGLAARHTFPLDGEYTFKLRLTRDPTVLTILGIEEDEHQIELRVDHALVKQFHIGGQVKGQDPGTLVAPTDDDVAGRQIHDYRMTADKDLEFRTPVKAGTRLVAAAFTDRLPSALEASGRRSGSVGLDTLQISGPFDGRVPADTPSRQRIFVCTPTGSRAEEPCARTIIDRLVRRAYRRPATEQEIKSLLDVYRGGRDDSGDFDAGIELVLEALLSSPK